MNVTAHELQLESLDAVTGVDTLALFVSEEDRPLPGLAGYVDWRLCGALSRHLQSGFFVGAEGDSLLLPSDGRLPIPRIVVFGVGSRRQLDAGRLSSLLEGAARALNKVQSEAVALELPGQGSLDEEARAKALTRAFVLNFRGAEVKVLGEKSLHKHLGK